MLRAITFYLSLNLKDLLQLCLIDVRRATVALTWRKPYCMSWNCLPLYISVYSNYFVVLSWKLFWEQIAMEQPCRHLAKVLKPTLWIDWRNTIKPSWVIYNFLEIILAMLYETAFTVGIGWKVSKMKFEEHCLVTSSTVPSDVDIISFTTIRDEKVHLLKVWLVLLTSDQNDLLSLWEES